jgi:ribosomal-protein-alanine N-acetyltransferase
MKIQGETIYIRFLEESDAPEYLNLELKNKDFFEKYSANRPSDYYTIEAQTNLIKRNIMRREKDEIYLFGIFEKASGALLGNITLSEVLRGPLQSCLVGYKLDLCHNGKGYMSEAVSLAIKYAFEELKLHRIEAGVMPSNPSSMRVLEKAGFIKEGLARKNVMVNGKWEDHQMLAIIAEDYFTS